MNSYLQAQHSLPSPYAPMLLFPVTPIYFLLFYYLFQVVSLSNFLEKTHNLSFFSTKKERENIKIKIHNEKNLINRKKGRKQEVMKGRKKRKKAGVCAAKIVM